MGKLNDKGRPDNSGEDDWKCITIMFATMFFNLMVMPIFLFAFHSENQLPLSSELERHVKCHLRGNLSCSNSYQLKCLGNGMIDCVTPRRMKDNSHLKMGDSGDILLKHIEETPELVSLYSDLYTYLLTIRGPKTLEASTKVHPIMSNQQRESQDSSPTEQSSSSYSLKMKQHNMKEGLEKIIRSGDAISKVTYRNVQGEDQEQKETTRIIISAPDPSTGDVPEKASILSSPKLNSSPGSAFSSNNGNHRAQDPEESPNLLSTEIQVKKSNLLKPEYFLMPLNNKAEINASNIIFNEPGTQGNDSITFSISNLQEIETSTKPLTVNLPDQQYSFQDILHPEQAFIQSSESDLQQSEHKKPVGRMISPNHRDTTSPSSQLQNFKSFSSHLHSDTSSPSDRHDDTSPLSHLHGDTSSPSHLHDHISSPSHLHGNTSSPSHLHGDTSSSSHLHGDRTSPSHLHGDTSSSSNLHRNSSSPLYIPGTESFLDDTETPALDRERENGALASTGLSGHISSRYMSDPLHQLRRLRRHLARQKETMSQDQQTVRLLHDQSGNKTLNGALSVIESLLLSDYCLVSMFNCSSHPTIDQCRGFATGTCRERERINAIVASIALTLLTLICLCFAYLIFRILTIDTKINKVGDEDIEKAKKTEK